MGIKNLKALLLSHGSLKPYEPAEGERYPAVFVDGFSVLMTMAYSCADEEEFRTAVAERVQHWTRIADAGRLVVFLDRGEIAIKQPLREQRRRATRERANRNRAIVAKAEAEDLEEQKRLRDNREARDAQERQPAPPDDEFAEEIRAEKQLKLQRIRFQLSIASHDVVKSLIASALRSAGENVETVYCDGVDAEMVMCTRGRAAAEAGGRWPLLVTTDQDALLFTATDRLPKVVSTVSACYLFTPTAETEYLCKLAALTNGCDFFPGLGGISVSVESLSRMALFEEFTPANVAASLCTRPMRLAGVERAERAAVADAVSFIERYARGDEGIYRCVPPDACCGRSFILGAALDDADALLAPTGLGVVADMIMHLPPQREPTPEELALLEDMEARARAGRVIDAHVMRTAELLGYSECQADLATTSVSAAKGVLLRLRGTRAFVNAEHLEIESEPRLLKLA
ncbi:putative FEN-1 like endonuclease [Parapoxvirus red deer/HL953]|uniref:Putative FEN-1 like endonuclease n=1 Tax=Parapoxvirus red deer/HL953 TaxID=1579460 RepID=A0A0A7MC34_9POXV|nr:putative FEN-1 like endonuclease [Parapoxvirus red deer/HL953]AIZ77292.1 putative FEN-1 like endonuclease [Parapoxvirus red deer/HL953]